MARARLKVIYESNDGFEIAREDLRCAGPGEFLGARQSGAPLLRFADLERDVDLIEAARDVADELIAANSPAVDAPPRPLARQPPVLPQGMNPVARAPRRLREADPARPADRHPAAALADALGRCGSRARGVPDAWSCCGSSSLGTVLMRSAGCAINDFADRDFDAHVERTRDRPLAAGRIRPWEALVVAGGAGARAFAIVLQFNALTVKLSFVALGARGRSTRSSSASSGMPQAWLGHRVRLRHPDGLRRDHRARCRRSRGRCSRPTSSGPSPTTPSTRWWTARTTAKLGTPHLGDPLRPPRRRRGDGAATRSSSRAWSAIGVWQQLRRRSTSSGLGVARRHRGLPLPADPRAHARGLLQGVPAQQLDRRGDLRRHRCSTRPAVGARSRRWRAR